MAYAIFEAAGRQFRAEAGDSIRMPLMSGDPGTKLTFDQVLLTADGDKVKTGQPMVTGAKVLGRRVGDRPSDSAEQTAAGRPDRLWPVRRGQRHDSSGRGATQPAPAP